MDLSKNVVIEQLESLISDAQRVSITELCKKGNYKQQPDLRYPQTKGEYIADSISTLLASQSWIDGTTEPLLDDILEVAGELDKDANQPNKWEQLFNLAEQIQS